MDQEDIYSKLLVGINQANNGQNSWILVLVGSLGDLVLTASLIPAFRELHPGRLTLIHPPYIAPIFPALGVTAETFIAKDLLHVIEQCRPLVRQLSILFAPGVPIVCLPYYYGNLWRAFASGHISLAHNFREILRLGHDCPLSYFPPGRPRPATAGPHRVLISPVTKTVPDAGHTYWSAVARALRDHGCDVDVNLSGEARAAEIATARYAGCRAVQLSIQEVMEDSDLYSGLVGHSTGLPVMQAMVQGETPVFFVTSVDPNVEFFRDKGGITQATCTQNIESSGVTAQRPVHYLSSFTMNPEELADAILRKLRN